MCGIFGVAGARSATVRPEQVMQSIGHRGPDDRGHFLSDQGDCLLGQVRLSIIDISSAGHQPMVDASGRYVMVYNGEIYNYSDLRREIEDACGPVHWRSTTDSEVLLEGYARLGLGFLDRLNGIFALAIYDRQEQTVDLLRDPLGIKPLFYTEQHGRLFFCSELKGIVAMEGLTFSIRKQSLADQLAFMYVPEPHTLYQQVLKLQPGLLVRYSGGKRVFEKLLYANLYSPMSFQSEQDMVDTFAEAFSVAVKRQMVSDVPVSLMLSGGLDSSAVAYEAAGHGANIHNAFVIATSAKDRAWDGQGDDLAYARLMADRLGLQLEVIEAEVDFMALLSELGGFLEDGISDPAAINTYLICKAARDKGVKVLLTGQGADEFLAGYRRYLAEDYISKMSGFSKGILAALNPLIPGQVPGRLNAVMRRIKRMTSLARLPEAERVLGMYTWGTPKTIHGLLLDSEGLDTGREFLDSFRSLPAADAVEGMMLMDRAYDLLSLNLTYTDRMSMAAGVEARVPFLDFDLVRVMNSIPTAMKLKGNVTKYPLKKAMEGKLPHDVIYRSKAGFAMPVRSWLRGDSEIREKYLSRQAVERVGIFSPAKIEELWQQQVSGIKDNANLLTSLICIQSFMENHSI